MRNKFSIKPVRRDAKKIFILKIKENEVKLALITVNLRKYIVKINNKYKKGF